MPLASRIETNGQTSCMEFINRKPPFISALMIGAGKRATSCSRKPPNAENENIRKPYEQGLALKARRMRSPTVLTSG